MEYLPQESLTPQQIVSELDKYIIGQNEAKIAVAIALRNRYRRSKLSTADREEITPKNIILKAIKKKNTDAERLSKIREEYEKTKNFLLGK